MSKPLTLIAATAIVGLASLLPIQPASAQSARYCNNTVNANSFRVDIRPDPQNAQQRSVAFYFVQLQNMGSDRRVRVAFFSSEPGLTRGGGSYTVHPGEAPASSSDILVKAFEMIDVQLGSHRLNNPAGAGALSATNFQTGLPHFTGVTCSP